MMEQRIDYILRLCQQPRWRIVTAVGATITLVLGLLVILPSYAVLADIVIDAYDIISETIQEPTAQEQTPQDLENDVKDELAEQMRNLYYTAILDDLAIQGVLGALLLAIGNNLAIIAIFIPKYKPRSTV